MEDLKNLEIRRATKNVPGPWEIKYNRLKKNGNMILSVYSVLYHSLPVPEPYIVTVPT